MTVAYEEPAETETVLQETTCLVAVHVHQWGASKTDRKASKQVTDDAGATEDSARVIKTLLPKRTLDEIGALRTVIMTNWRRYSSPWGDEGHRIMSTADDHFEAFLSDHAKAVRAFEAKVLEVAGDEAHWQSVINHAKVRMAGLWKEGEFPSREQFINMFYVDLNWGVTAPDWRARLSDAHASRIAKDVEAQMTNSIEKATADAWKRLYDVVEKMAERLAAYPGRGKGRKGTFYDTLVTNVTDLCGVMNGLNITGDPELARLTAAVCSSLTQHDADTLKDDDVLRAKVQTDAANLVAAMKQAYGGVQ